MKEKRLVRNIVSNIVLQIISTISGLLIPRLLLVQYGSTINGMISSISQFISYAMLVEMGISNAASVALYRPIAENDIKTINGIVNTVKKIYARSGSIYIFLMGILAFTYPLLVQEQVQYELAFIMVLCIGFVNVVDFFFLGKYKVFLIADQKYYILNIIKIAATIILIFGSVVLLHYNIFVFWVKSWAILTHFIEALFVCGYVNGKYPSFNVNSNLLCKIEQRWSALCHQICAVIVYNTDLVVLTICMGKTSLFEVSVYAVYSLAFNALTNFVNTFTTGVAASFGGLWAVGEKDKAKHYWGLYEFGYIGIVCLFCGCFTALIFPFVSCYTQGVLDTEYIRYDVGILFALCGVSALLKDAASIMINAAGKYRDTQKYTIYEAIINIIISLTLVKRFAISGVLMGTFISHVIMSFCIMRYVAKNLLVGTGVYTLRRVLRNFLTMGGLVVIEFTVIQLSHSWMQWIVLAIGIFIFNTMFLIAINYLCEKRTAKAIVTIVKNFVFVH